MTVTATASGTATADPREGQTFDTNFGKATVVTRLPPTARMKGIHCVTPGREWYNIFREGGKLYLLKWPGTAAGHSQR
jgi:hypothetical protein